MSFIKVLHTGLHTWYVGARPAPATIRGSTDRRVPPTCRRLPRDFALFPQAIGIHLRLTGSVHQKSRSRPASAYQPSRRHVGGDGFNVLSDKRVSDDFVSVRRKRIPRLQEKAHAIFYWYHDLARSARALTFFIPVMI